jgi:hypothetical protein
MRLPRRSSSGSPHSPTHSPSRSSGKWPARPRARSFSLCRTDRQGRGHPRRPAQVDRRAGADRHCVPVRARARWPPHRIHRSVQQRVYLPSRGAGRRAKRRGCPTPCSSPQPAPSPRIPRRFQTATRPSFQACAICARWRGMSRRLSRCRQSREGLAPNQEAQVVMRRIEETQWTPAYA